MATVDGSVRFVKDQVDPAFWRAHGHHCRWRHGGGLRLLRTRASPPRLTCRGLNAPLRGRKMPVAGPGRGSSARAADLSQPRRELMKGEHRMATVTEPRRKAARKFQTKLLIDGKFRDSQSGKTFATINPATEEVIAQVCRGRRGRHRPGREGRAQGVRLGPVAEDGRARPRPADEQAGRPDRGTHRRAGRARDARQRQADQREPQRRPAPGHRLPALLRRLGRQDPRSDDPDPGQLLLLHPARAGRRGRPDHPLELSRC